MLIAGLSYLSTLDDLAHDVPQPVAGPGFHP